MEKLELKHLTPYLPYDVSFITIVKGGGAAHGKEFYRKKYLNIKNFETLLDSSNKKLILRPLSDLTKEIEVDGWKFKPIEELNSKHEILNLSFYKMHEGSEWTKPTILFNSSIDGYNLIALKQDIEMLYKWHFDLNNLIEQGLAIDINTLEN